MILDIIAPASMKNDGTCFNLGLKSGIDQNCKQLKEFSETTLAMISLECQQDQEATEVKRRRKLTKREIKLRCDKIKARYCNDSLQCLKIKQSLFSDDEKERLDT